MNRSPIKTQNLSLPYHMIAFGCLSVESIPFGSWETCKAQSTSGQSLYVLKKFIVDKIICCKWLNVNARSLFFVCLFQPLLRQCGAAHRIHRRNPGICRPASQFLLFEIRLCVPYCFTWCTRASALNFIIETRVRRYPDLWIRETGMAIYVLWRTIWGLWALPSRGVLR